MQLRLICLLGLINIVFANGSYLQERLMEIALQEAQIANIGANKATMLYGINNPIEIIEQWNKMEQKPILTNYQLEQIQVLEIQKQNIIRQEKN